jgi:hypothetical protein
LTFLERPCGQGEEPEAKQGDECVGGRCTQNAENDGRDSHCQGEAFENERDKGLVCHADLQGAVIEGSAGIGIVLELEPFGCYEDTSPVGKEWTPNGLELSRPASSRILPDRPRPQLAGRRSPVIFRGVGSIELLGGKAVSAPAA